MQKIRFGVLESKALFALEEVEAGVVTLAELAKKLGLSRVRAWKLASRLVRKKRLIRLKRGVFLFAPMKSGPRGLWSENALALVPVLAAGKEHYVGFWAALNHYGLTEQIPFAVQIVTTVRVRSLEALSARFEFVQVRRLGEWREEEIGGGRVRFATVEQLILDCFSMPEKCGGMKEACKALWNAKKTLDWKKLDALAAKSNDAVRRRLGYARDLLGIGKTTSGKRVGWRWLDPSAHKKEFGKSRKWGLRLNVADEELVEWREY